MRFRKGSSAPPTINKLLTEDEVAAVFGGWTSASRKAMLPVVEGANGLLFYPVQYEGLEASENIYYTGATTNQQIIPAMDFLASEGVETLFLAGSEYVFPRTANKIIKQYAEELGSEIVGEEYVPLDSDDWTTQVAKIAAAKPDFVFNTINGASNVGFIKAYDEAGLGPDNSPIISVTSPSPTSTSSHLAVRARVAGTLAWRPEPTVLVAGCHHVTTVHLELTGRARVEWCETVVLGRHGEPSGSMLQRLVVDRAGRPLLRNEVPLGPRWPASGGPAGTDGARVVSSTLLVGLGAPGHVDDGAVLQLADDAWLLTRLGREVGNPLRAHDVAGRRGGDRRVSLA